MIRDVLRGERCPRPGAGAIAAESERVGVLRQHGMCEHLVWWCIEMWLVRCGLCGFTWPVVAQAGEVSLETVLAAVGHA